MIGNCAGRSFELELCRPPIVHPRQPFGIDRRILGGCAEQNCADGAEPNGLIVDPSGYLFGTSTDGGASGGGTLFELAHGAIPGSCGFVRWT